MEYEMRDTASLKLTNHYLDFYLMLSVGRISLDLIGTFARIGFRVQSLRGIRRGKGLWPTTLLPTKTRTKNTSRRVANIFCNADRIPRIYAVLKNMKTAY